MIVDRKFNSTEYLKQYLFLRINDLSVNMWIQTMNEEYKSMQNNKVWELVPLPEDVKPIGCKWIFKTKRDSKGNVERYKARLVAKDYT